MPLSVCGQLFQTIVNKHREPSYIRQEFTIVSHYDSRLPAVKFTYHGIKTVYLALYIYSCNNMFAHHYSCVPTITVVCPPSQLCAHHHSCVSTITVVCSPSQLFVNHHSCLSTITVVCPPLQLCAHHYSCVPTITVVCPPSQLCVHHHSCLPTITVVCPPLQLFVHHYSCLPIITNVIDKSQHRHFHADLTLPGQLI